MWKCPDGRHFPSPSRCLYFTSLWADTNFHSHMGLVGRVFIFCWPHSLWIFTLITTASLNESYEGEERIQRVSGETDTLLEAVRPCESVLMGDISLPPVGASVSPPYGQILISIPIWGLLEEIISITSLPSSCLFQYTSMSHYCNCNNPGKR